MDGFPAVLVRLGVLDGISVALVRLGVPWGEVWILGFSLGTGPSISTAEVLSHSWDFVWLVYGSRFGERGRDDGEVPGRVGGGPSFLS